MNKGDKNLTTAQLVRAIGDGKKDLARGLLEKVLREKAAKRISDILGH